MVSRSTKTDNNASGKDESRARSSVKQKSAVVAKAKARSKAPAAGKGAASSKASKAKQAPIKKAAANKKAVAEKLPAGVRGKVASAKGRARSAAGRPPRLSRKMVLESAMRLLEEGPVEDFTMARVAAALDTVSMALYNYFPSRQALLAAVADHICMRFKMPPPKRNQTWQDTLTQWLWTFKKLSDEYPFVLKVMGVDGKSSPGWLRVTLTVSRTLYDIGFREHQLAVHSWMFCSHAIALVFNEREGSIFRSPISLSDIDELEPDEQDFLIMLRRYHSDIASEEVLELGFQGIIANVERELAQIQAASLSK